MRSKNAVLRLRLRCDANPNGDPTDRPKTNEIENWLVDDLKMTKDTMDEVDGMNEQIERKRLRINDRMR